MSVPHAANNMPVVTNANRGNFHQRVVPPAQFTFPPSHYSPYPVGTVLKGGDDRPCLLRNNQRARRHDTVHLCDDLRRSANWLCHVFKRFDLRYAYHCSFVQLHRNGYGCERIHGKPKFHHHHRRTQRWRGRLRFRIYWLTPAHCSQAEREVYAFCSPD